MLRMTKLAAREKAKRLAEYREGKVKSKEKTKEDQTEQEVIAYSRHGDRLTGWTQILQHYVKHRDENPGKPFELAPLQRVVDIGVDDPRYPAVTKKVVACASIESGTVLGLYGGLVVFEKEEHDKVISYKNRFHNCSRIYELKKGQSIHKMMDGQYDRLLINAAWFGDWTSEINDMRANPFVKIRDPVHDKTSNCDFVETFVENWPIAFIVSTANISIGEELLLDYTHGYWKSLRIPYKDYTVLQDLSPHEVELAKVQMPAYELEELEEKKGGHVVTPDQPRAQLPNQEISMNFDIQAACNGTSAGAANYENQNNISVQGAKRMRDEGADQPRKKSIMPWGQTSSDPLIVDRHQSFHSKMTFGREIAMMN